MDKIFPYKYVWWSYIYVYFLCYVIEMHYRISQLVRYQLIKNNLFTILNIYPFRHLDNPQVNLLVNLLDNQLVNLVVNQLVNLLVNLLVNQLVNLLVNLLLNQVVNQQDLLVNQQIIHHI